MDFKYLTKGLPADGERQRVPRLRCESQSAAELENPMSEITRIGVDLVKHVLQIHAVDMNERLVQNKALG